MPNPKIGVWGTAVDLGDGETIRSNVGLTEEQLCAALREKGIEPDLVDPVIGTPEDTLEQTLKPVRQENGLLRVGMSRQRIEEVLAQKQYDILAIPSIFTTQTLNVFDIARTAKKVNPRCLVITGGVNARAEGPKGKSMWERFGQTGDFNIIATSWGEKVIQMIAQRWIDGASYEKIPGTILFRKGDDPLKTEPDPSIFYENPDDIPFPAWDLADLPKRAKIASHGVDLTSNHEELSASVMTSWGCPFWCKYCWISQVRFGRGTMSGNIGNLLCQSPERVFQGLQILKDMGVTKVLIEDDSFFARIGRATQILRKMIGLGFILLNVNGINLVHMHEKVNGQLVPNERLIRLNLEAGFNQIVFPVESGSQEMLDEYASGKLNLATMDIPRLIKTWMRIAEKMGVKFFCPVNIMIGYPKETEAHMMQSVEYAKRLIGAGAPYVTFFIVTPFPGSELYRIAIEDGHLDPDIPPWRYNWKRAMMRNTAMDPRELENFRDWATQEVNTKEHLALRELNSAGYRWQSGAPTAP